MLLEVHEKKILQKAYFEPFHKKKLNDNFPLYQSSHCSDSIRLEILPFEKQKIEVYFSAEGCQLSVASASLMCESVNHKTVEECLTLISQVRNCIKKGEKICFNQKLSYLNLFFQKPHRSYCTWLAWESLEKELYKFLH